MRSNVVMIILVVLLIAFGGGIAMRGRETHVTPVSPDATAAPEASAGASASGSAMAATSASASPATTTSASSAPAKDPGPRLKRPLRVVGTGWELLAAGIMSNDGVTPGPASWFKKKGLEVELSAHADVSKVENALARGGEHEKGADVAVLPLQTFVTSYERLKALNPVIFYVVAWSDGREVVTSKHESFDKLPAKGEVKLRGDAGEPAAFLGLFALDLAGVSPDRVKLVAEGDKPEWSAITREQSKGKSQQTQGNVLLTTSEASRLVPFVAIAQSSLVEGYPKAMAVLVKGWLEGHKRVASSASDAARKIAETKGAPEPLSVLSRLGELQAASLAENAHAAGLAGRGAVTLEALFQRSWRIWRDAKVISIPPETAPVNGKVIANLVLAGEGLTAPPKTGGDGDASPSKDKPILVHRFPKGELDEERLIEEIGFVAGVFRRSPIRVSVHPRAALDAKQTALVVARARERFDLPADRLVEGKARALGANTATIEIMPVP